MDFEKVKEIIVETLSCDADKVTMEATLAEDLEAFGISIADEDLPGLKTVGDLYKYLQDHADGAEAAEKAE